MMDNTKIINQKITKFSFKKESNIHKQPTQILDTHSYARI